MNEDSTDREERVNLELSVGIIKGIRSIGDCETVNLSMNGMFIETDEEFNVGHKLHLRLRTDTDLLLQIDAKVVHTSNDGIGVKFSALDTNTFHHLKSILSKNSTYSNKELEEQLTF